MELAIAEVDVETAQVKYDEYRAAVRARHDAEDAAIMRAYREVLRGNQVLALTPTLQLGGRDEEGLPRLAVCRADAKKCWLERCTYDGAFEFVTKQRSDATTFRATNNKRDVRAFPAGTLPELPLPEDAAERYVSGTSSVPGLLQRRRGAWRDIARSAIVPSVPPALRPAHALGNYEILWEVELWRVEPVPPRDPALLKHMGGDLYAVLAVWDLTELERLVIAGRAL